MDKRGKEIFSGNVEVCSTEVDAKEGNEKEKGISTRGKIVGPVQFNGGGGRFRVRTKKQKGRKIRRKRSHMVLGRYPHLNNNRIIKIEIR